jgi:hypothetical protein
MVLSSLSQIAYNRGIRGANHLPLSGLFKEKIILDVISTQVSYQHVLLLGEELIYVE